ncbi:MAG: hypothetical protein OEZ47_15585 [Gammaproteobacteria bacterium]|nr:hypothetical protein [Gammaproteobacteria bacterium]
MNPTRKTRIAIFTISLFAFVGIVVFASDLTASGIQLNHIGHFN